MITKYLLILYWVNFCTTSPQCRTQLTNLLLKFIFLLQQNIAWLSSQGDFQFLQWSNFSPISFTVNHKHVFLEQRCLWFYEVRLAIDLIPKYAPNGSQKWIILSNLGPPPKILLQPVNFFTHTCLPYHWHYYATAAFMTEQLKISILCAVECVLAKKKKRNRNICHRISSESN